MLAIGHFICRVYIALSDSAWVCSWKRQVWRSITLHHMASQGLQWMK